MAIRKQTKRPSKKFTTDEIEELTNYQTKLNENDKTNLLDLIRVNIKCKTENQKKLINSIKENDVTVSIGSAGCGKTFIACATALKLLKENPEKYKDIKLVKSITKLKNEDIGTLPGTPLEKLMIYMMSYMDSFYKLIGEDATNKLLEAGFIKIEVLGAVRGRSFNNTILIADEFQNIVIDNAKTLLTRISDDSKYIILGDVDQIDLKDKKESSLKYIADKILANKVDGVDAIIFDDDDIIRHRLTKYFLNMFKD
jgi:phosphate starvation-inducible PhoH-like protein